MRAPSTIELSEIMASKSGSVNPAKYANEVFDLYSIPAFDRRKPEVVAGRAIGSTKQIVKPGDVLLSKIVPHIRRTWVVGHERGNRIIASGEWIVFRSNRVDPAYLRHVLMGDPFHNQFMRTVSGVGGSLLRARPAYVAEIRIPFPPLPEQRRISAILDKAEQLNAKRRVALDEFDNLTQSIFLEMVGDPATNSKGWPIVELGSLLESATYGTSKKAGGTGAWPVLRMNNITYNGEMDLSDLKYIDLTEKEVERHTVKVGDILFNRTNSAELVGKTAVFRGSKPMAYAGYLIRLRLNSNNNPEFLSTLLNSNWGKRTLRGMCKSIIGMANINATEIQALKVFHPPLLVQNEFARRVGAVKKLKVVHRASLAELDALFASLQHRAFRGEL